MTDAQSAVVPPPRKVRPPPRPVIVEAVERVTPGVVRVTFTGDNLASFAQSKPGAHMKLFFAPEDATWPPARDAPRPPSRTYTPRRFDAARSQLEVEFVLHGDGLASRWSERARVGDRMLLNGPGGGYQIPGEARRLVIVADETSMPAAGMVVEALPQACRVEIFCEIDNKAEERTLSPLVASAPTWLHRAPDRAKPGSLLETALEGLTDLTPDTYFWIACEAGAMRRIRDFLTVRRGIDRARLHSRGYWKFGEFNYPDHDYGND